VYKRRALWKHGALQRTLLKEEKGLSTGGERRWLERTLWRKFFSRSPKNGDCLNWRRRQKAVKGGSILLRKRTWVSRGRKAAEGGDGKPYIFSWRKESRRELPTHRLGTAEARPVYAKGGSILWNAILLDSPSMRLLIGSGPFRRKGGGSTTTNNRKREGGRVS